MEELDRSLEPETASAAAPDQTELAAALNRTEAKRCFSRLGLGAFAILMIATVLQILISAVMLRFGAPAWASESWAMWVMTFAPLYCVAMPVGLLIMRSVPAHPAQPSKFGAGRFVTLIPICIFFMYAGNLVGTLITSLFAKIKGGEVSNPLEAFALGEGSLFVKILVMVILAPLLEEFIFRRVMIDRMRIYGEKTAVVTSALMFGLFHGNLSQFFYAAALGMIFGYVYVKTGKLRYSAALHMGVNALGSILAPYLLENAGLEKLGDDASELLSDPAALGELVTPGLMLFGLYALLLVVFAILGLVLLCVHGKRVSFSPAERELPAEGRLKLVWCNAGMILLVLGCLVMIVLSILQ